MTLDKMPEVGKEACLCECCLAECPRHSSATEPDRDYIGRYTEGYAEGLNLGRLEAQATREEVLERIETYLCSCMWSDAPDCPGATNGEVICDGCERFEYPYPEDAREYVKSLRSGGK